jgi:hypothetical protein
MISHYTINDHNYKERKMKVIISTEKMEKSKSVLVKLTFFGELVVLLFTEC